MYSYSTTIYWPNLSSMFDPEVTILAYDLSRRIILLIPIEIDGNWVTSGNAADLSETYHLFHAADRIRAGHSTVSLTAATTIAMEHTFRFRRRNHKVFYNYIPTYTLTLGTMILMSNNVNAGIYVDGNYVGSGYVSMQVPLGYHTISVDDVVWNDYQQCYSNFFCWWDSNTG